ncbi:MAG: hypothetical protein NT040_05605 [Bacteroidetes bacterium]|nr:hypothetical protein [Bacteroidota bacterium]
MFDNGRSRKTIVAGILATALLAVFILVNDFRNFRDTHQTLDPKAQNGRERLPVGLEGTGKRFAFYDFESGNALDTGAHLAARGHGGKLSLVMSSHVPFSPGLWIKCKDLNTDSTWIRATGYVWFSCQPEEVRCNLVATCNRSGVNFKYMFVALENEQLKPNQWNRVSIDYRVPAAAGKEDVVQAYFWYRGSGVMLVDDVEVEFFMPAKLK